MHICFASLDYPDESGCGGVGIYVRTLGRELVKQGHEVSVIALSATNKQYCTDDEGIKIHWVGHENIHWYVSKIPFLGPIFSLPLRELEYSWSILKTIRRIDAEFPIDIVEGIETGTYGFRWLRPGIKTVIRLHGETYSCAKYTPPGDISIDILLSRCLQRSAIKKAHFLTAPSRTHGTEVESETGLPFGTVKVVVNPLSAVNFAADKQTLQPDKPIFLFVGRLGKAKGIIELLKAVPLILGKLPSSEFFLLGNFHPSAREEDLKKLILKLGIGEKVHFSGHLQQDQIHDYYRRATVVVIPSFYESFGYIYIEALMHGKPVVAFDISAARNFVIHGKNGLLVPVGDVEALADACFKAVSMNVEFPDRNMFEEFNVVRIYAEMLTLYRQLLPGGCLIQGGSIDQSIILSPHYDDAVFSCGGIMQACSRQGIRNLVVNIFGGEPDIAILSPFAQAIHDKWRLSNPISMRILEDKVAMEIIGAQSINLDFLDSIYRRTTEGAHLYTDYESLATTLHTLDRELIDNVYEKVKEIMQGYDPGNTQILVPLGIGNHVDHQIAHKVGIRLMDEGFKILFYEDIPYSMWFPEQLKTINTVHDTALSPLVIPINMKAKITMIKNYRSQLRGIGGNYRIAAENFKKYALAAGSGVYAERVWFPEVEKNRCFTDDVCAAING